MAHVGEEGALGAAGGQRAVARFDSLQPLLFGVLVCRLQLPGELDSLHRHTVEREARARHEDDEHDQQERDPGAVALREERVVDDLREHGEDDEDDRGAANGRVSRDGSRAVQRQDE